LDAGTTFDDVTAFFKARGALLAFREVVVITVEHAPSVTSPAYDLGFSEAEIRERWERHYEAIKLGFEQPTGE
jgi:hypothetical protein